MYLSHAMCHVLGEKYLGTGEVKENGGKLSGLGCTKGEEEETETLHLHRNNWPSF